MTNIVGLVSWGLHLIFPSIPPRLLIMSKEILVMSDYREEWFTTHNICWLGPTKPR